MIYSGSVPIVEIGERVLANLMLYLSQDVRHP